MDTASTGDVVSGHRHHIYPVRGKKKWRWSGSSLVRRDHLLLWAPEWSLLMITLQATAIIWFHQVPGTWINSWLKSWVWSYADHRPKQGVALFVYSSIPSILNNNIYITHRLTIYWIPCYMQWKTKLLGHTFCLFINVKFISLHFKSPYDIILYFDASRD